MNCPINLGTFKHILICYSSYESCMTLAIKRTFLKIFFSVSHTYLIICINNTSNFKLNCSVCNYDIPSPVQIRLEIFSFYFYPVVTLFSHFNKSIFSPIFSVKTVRLYLSTPGGTLMNTAY